MFDWDEGNVAHIASHDVLPTEAEEVVSGDPLDLEMQVVGGEERFPQIGLTRRGKVLVVITTPRGLLTRVVTAFPASPAYQRFYFSQRGPGPSDGKATRA